MKKSLSIKGIALFSGSVALIAISFFVYNTVFAKSPLKEVVVEVGSPFPSVIDFLSDDRKNGTFVTDVNAVDLSSVSVSDMEIKVGRKSYHTTLSVIDTVAPKAVAVKQVILGGAEINPSDFVTEITDKTQVMVSFNSAVDFNTEGKRAVEILLEDKGGNRSVVTSELTVVVVKKSISLEAGGSRIPKASEFIQNTELSSEVKVSFAKNFRMPSLTKPGEYNVQLSVDDYQCQSVVKVFDTTPPTAKAAKVKTYTPQTAAPETFVNEISDVSTVAVSFVEQPDFVGLGEKTVKLRLTDSYGNSSEVTAELDVSRDITPPVISGTINKFAIVGGTVSYKQGIVVTDDVDTKPKLTADSSAVDLTKVGAYNVVFTATDFSGNTTSVTGVVSVAEVSADVVNQLADAIIAKIIKENMTPYEQAYAVFKYVRNNIKYTSKGEKESPLKGAYNAFKLKKGDCYTFYAASEYLLTKLGIDNLPITRTGGKTRHYWNLVNLGEGWYHFDACPHYVWFDGCMFTDTVAQEYTRSRGNNYYVYNEKLYPEIVK